MKARKYSDISNIKFNLLTVLNSFRTIKNNKNRLMWNCLCDCGNKVITNYSSLESGKTKSCGCYFKNIIAPKNGKNNRIGENEAGFNLLYNSYKKSAKKRNLEFSLSKDSFKELTKKNCYHCGREPIQISGYRKSLNKSLESLKYSNYVYNGVDRLNPKLGYIESNSVASCQECNFGKTTKTEKEFNDWIKRVYEFKFNKNI
jgi:hypothetical protein